MRRFIFISLIILLNSCNVKYRTSGIDDFEFLWTTIDQNYPFLDFKNIDWDSLYYDYKPKFKRVFKDEKIELLCEMIDLLQDGHAAIIKNGRKINSYKMPRSESDKNLFSMELVQSYFNNEGKKVEIFEFATISDSIGYIHIDNWYSNDSTIEKFDEILFSLRNTRGLIIDLRHNTGGKSKNAYYVFQRLLKEPVHGFKWTKDNGDFFPIVKYTPEGEYQYTRPIVILINGVSFSASENIANLSKTVDHITLVGNTTAGGGGIPRSFNLPCGLELRLPTRTMLRYDDEEVEWNGIPPDILVKNRIVDLEEGKDKQLEFAIEYLH